jgi:hypothetical protein
MMPRLAECGTGADVCSMCFLLPKALAMDPVISTIYEPNLNALLPSKAAHDDGSETKSGRTRLYSYDFVTSARERGSSLAATTEDEPTSPDEPQFKWMHFYSLIKRRPRLKHFGAYAICPTSRRETWRPASSSARYESPYNHTGPIIQFTGLAVDASSCVCRKSAS